MAYTPPNPNGQATMATSAPVSIASDQSAVPVVITDTNATGQSAQTATVNNILPATAGANGTDCSGLRSAAVQVVSTGTGGTFIFEGSNDNTNYVAVPVFNQLILTGTPITAAVTATASTIIYLVPITFRYLRLRIAGTITGGNIQAITRFSDEAFSPAVGLVGQATAANLNVTASVSQLAAAAAMADAQGNPTTSPEAALASQFNGATWDRQRNNVNTTTGDTGAKTVTFNGATQTNFNARGAIITALFGTVTGTVPTIALQLQWSFDAGTTFLNYGTAIAAFTPASTNTATFVVYPTQLADDTTTTLSAFTVGATQSKAMNAPIPRTWRIVYTLAGTTPSITLTSVNVNYIN